MISENNRILIVRNTTIENTFKNGYRFSGYDNWLESDIAQSKFVVWFYLIGLNKTNEQRRREIEGFRFKVNFLLSQCRKLKKPIVLLTLPYVRCNSIQSQTDNFNKDIATFNNWLYSFQSASDKIFVFETNQFGEISHLTNPKYFWTNMIGINPKLSQNFLNWFENELDCILQLKRKKCLVLDLDNTLWKGVLSEDGINGIYYHGDYPGNVFNYVQTRIQELSQSGILIALCSKNTHSEIEKFWINNDTLPLKWDSIIAHRINWKDKSTNIKEIADELNIGLDSIVFIDDNPTERSWVMSTLPEVIVPEFPDKDYQIPAFLDDIVLHWFKKDILLEEDRNKLNQYRINQKRKIYIEDIGVKEDFLKSLEVEINLEPLTDINVRRVSQMSKKTNQFNFTQKKYEIEDLEQFIIDNNNLVFCVTVTDRFGDYGLTGVLIGSIEDQTDFLIDNFLLSCRILGKGVEELVFQEIQKNMVSRGILSIYGNFITTKRNEPALNFVKKEFEIIEETDKIIYKVPLINGK